MKTTVAWLCILCFCTLWSEVGICQSQQPDPNDPHPSQRSCVFEISEAGSTQRIRIPSMQESLELSLKKYSTEWAEDYTRLLDSGDESVVEPVSPAQQCIPYYSRLT